MAGPLRDDRLGGSAQLVWVLDRCLDEATYDLATRGGWDLGELFRERRWRLLWLLINQLPPASNTKAKLAEDEDFARMVLNGRDIDQLREASSGKAQVSLAEYTAEVSALYDVVDRLGSVVAGLQGLGGGKPRAPQRVPRPKSAIERMAVENRRSSHRALWERIRPRELTT